MSEDVPKKVKPKKKKKKKKELKGEPEFTEVNVVIEPIKEGPQAGRTYVFIQDEATGEALGADFDDLLVLMLEYKRHMDGLCAKEQHEREKRMGLV